MDYSLTPTFVWAGLIAVCFIAYLIISFHSARRYSFIKVDIPQYPNIVFYRGTPQGFKRFFSNHLSTHEHIVASSIVGPDGFIYAAMKRGRHHHAIALLNLFIDKFSLRSYKKESYFHKRWDHFKSQGFVTSYGRHVSREEAFAIATARGQILEKTGNKQSHELFSEDVWDTVPAYVNRPSRLKQIFVEDPCHFPPGTLSDIAEMRNILDMHQRIATAKASLSN